jgi:uncharacterized surface protein with fasciclin (FAS1) repeats
MTRGLELHINNVEMFMNIAIAEALCCAGVGATSWPFTNRVETLSGKSVAVRRDHDGRVHIGSTTVHDCDIPATNGIIHSVNRVCNSSSSSIYCIQVNPVTGQNHWI